MYVNRVYHVTVNQRNTEDGPRQQETCCVLFHVSFCWTECRWLCNGEMRSFHSTFTAISSACRLCAGKAQK